jgi:hypothetical protein
MVNAKTRVEIEGCRKAFIAGDFNQNANRRHLRKGCGRQVETAETRNRKGTCSAAGALF